MAEETVVGRDALTRLGVDVGDTVVLRGPKGRARLHVVGTATYPEVGNDSDVGIEWPSRNPILSDRDRANPGLREVLQNAPEYRG